MKVFTVIVTEIARNVWRKEITAANEDEAYDMADELERPWDEDENDTDWVYDNFASGLDEVTVDVIEK